jgi:hypothetical protein
MRLWPLLSVPRRGKPSVIKNAARGKSLVWKVFIFILTCAKWPLAGRRNEPTQYLSSGGSFQLKVQALDKPERG